MAVTEAAEELAKRLAGGRLPSRGTVLDEAKRVRWRELPTSSATTAAAASAS